MNVAPPNTQYNNEMVVHVRTLGIYVNENFKKLIECG